MALYQYCPSAQRQCHKESQPANHKARPSFISFSNQSVHILQKFYFFKIVFTWSHSIPMSKLVPLPNFVKKVEKEKMTKKRKTKPASAVVAPMEPIEPPISRSFASIVDLGMNKINSKNVKLSSIFHTDLYLKLR